MSISKAALITALAVCLAGNGAFARAARTPAHGKRSSFSPSAKKKKAALAASSRKHAKAHATPAQPSLGERFRGSFDIPLEELPVAEDDDPTSP